MSAPIDTKEVRAEARTRTGENWVLRTIDRLCDELDALRKPAGERPDVEKLAKLARYLANHGDRYERCAAKASLELGAYVASLEAENARLRELVAIDPGIDEGAVEQVRQKCERCDGCGKIASSDDGEPWTAWERLPPGSDLSVRMGLVKPLPCPNCGGNGSIILSERVLP